jgi:hypothetical protein
MHSIASVRSSSGAADYFANDNYYTPEENAEAGVWAARVRARSGLRVQVERDQFEGDPEWAPARWRDGRAGRGARLGLDLTFSMPKSASILALVSGDRRILDAHLAAVKSTMSQLVEKQFAESRNYERSRSGEPEKTGNLVYALFAHDTSRALDPQGHIHAVVANLTRDPQGQLEGAVERRDLEEQHDDRPVLPRRIPRPVAEARLRDRGRRQARRSKSRACPPRSSRRSRPAPRDRGQDRRNRRHQASRPRSRSRSTPAIPNCGPRGSRHACRGLADNAPPNWGSTASAGRRSQGAGRSAGPAHLPRNSHAAFAEVATRIGAACVHRARWP